MHQAPAATCYQAHKSSYQRTRIALPHSRRKQNDKHGHKRSSSCHGILPKMLTPFLEESLLPQPQSRTRLQLPAPKKMTRGKLGAASFLGVSYHCRRCAWAGGRDAASGKRGGNEEQMPRCLEHPRCYRSAKCDYHGQETGRENLLHSTSPRSLPSPGSGAEPPHQPQAKGSQPGGAVLAAAMPGTPRIRGAVKKGEEKGSIGELGPGVVQSQQHYEMIFPCMGLIWWPPCPGFPFSWVPSSLGRPLSSFLLHPAPPSKDVPERLGTTTGACWHQAGHGALLSPLCWQDAAQFDLG